MQYKIELRYLYGWDDANWTEEKDEVTSPMRFSALEGATAALNEFFANVKAAVAAGDLDVEESGADYRIVIVND